MQNVTCGPLIELEHYFYYPLHVEPACFSTIDYASAAKGIEFLMFFVVLLVLAAHCVLHFKGHFFLQSVNKAEQKYEQSKPDQNNVQQPAQESQGQESQQQIMKQPPRPVQTKKNEEPAANQASNQGGRISCLAVAAQRIAELSRESLVWGFVLVSFNVIGFASYYAALVIFIAFLVFAIVRVAGCANCGSRTLFAAQILQTVLSGALLLNFLTVAKRPFAS